MRSLTACYTPQISIVPVHRMLRFGLAQLCLFLAKFVRFGIGHGMRPSGCRGGSASAIFKWRHKEMIKGTLRVISAKR